MKRICLLMYGLLMFFMMNNTLYAKSLRKLWLDLLDVKTSEQKRAMLCLPNEHIIELAWALHMLEMLERDEHIDADTLQQFLIRYIQARLPLMSRGMVSSGGSNNHAEGNGAEANGVSGDSAIAIGSNSTAAVQDAIAIGDGASATSLNGIALGLNSVVTGTDGIAIGNGAIASQAQAIAIGSLDAIGTSTSGTTASAQNAIAMGGSYNGNAAAQAAGIGSIAIGGSDGSNPGAYTSGTSSVAIGAGASVSANTGVALGVDALVSAVKSVAIGNGATASASKSVAIGSGSTASGSKSIAIGINSTATVANSIVLGNPSSSSDAVAIGTSTPTTTPTTTAKLTIVTSGDQNAITVSNGTLSAPAYSFVNTNTAVGMYSPGQNQLALVASNTVRLLIDATQSVTYFSQYKVHAYRSSGQNITAGNNATIAFNSVAAPGFDLNGNFTTGTGVYTAPVTGYYFVSFAVSATTGGLTNATRTIVVQKNGSTLTGYTSQNGAATGTTPLQIGAATIVQLNQNDTLQLNYNNGGGGTDTILANSCLDIHFMSF